MHEMFLTRLAHHPVFRNDHNLRVFLEYDQDLCVRGNAFAVTMLQYVEIKINTEHMFYLFLQERIRWKCLVVW